MVARSSLKPVMVAMTGNPGRKTIDLPARQM
jgi:hypothetical protein